MDPEPTTLLSEYSGDGELEGDPILEYLPAVDLATGRLLGFEALVRWRHPEKGDLAPSMLIPWAEANGRIVEIGEWVVWEACRQAQTWSSGIQLAVNCSATQLRLGAASRAVESALRDTGMNPDRLSLEVNERALSDEESEADLLALLELGVHLAVDDVGSRWASLHPLRKYRVDVVKIDRPFVNGLEDDQGFNRALIEAIVQVGHSLSMTTVAEGVESSRQIRVLQEIGVDVGQGFFFCQPVSHDKAAAMANAQSPHAFSLESSAAGTEAEQLPPEAMSFLLSAVGARPED